MMNRFQFGHQCFPIPMKELKLLMQGPCHSKCTDINPYAKPESFAKPDSFVKPDSFAKPDTENSDNNTKQLKVNDKLYEYNECDSLPVSFATNGPMPMKHSRSHHSHHVHSDERPYKCPVHSCGKAFHRNDHLSRHSTVHTGEKPFKCEICEKGFARKDKLKLHKNVHLPERPFKRDLCDGGFSGGMCHKHSMINHNRKRTCKCEICGKLFYNNSHLRRHMIIHTGHKDFKCDQCGKEFSRKDGLQLHKDIHSGKKNFKCEICQKTFSHKWGLARHIREKAMNSDINHRAYYHNTTLATQARSHLQTCKSDRCHTADSSKKQNLNVYFLSSQAGEKQYQCKECSAHFSLEDILNDHIEVYHNMLKGIPMQAQQTV